MCKELTPWEKSVEFHGHVCPGLALGFKSTMIALRELGVARAQDEELVAIVETDACGVDAVQVLTGCTIGKGNLIFRDYGKQAYTFGNRKTGEAIRIAVFPSVMEQDPEHGRLRRKLAKREATEEERQEFYKRHLELTNTIINMADSDFAVVKRIKLDFPRKAQLFETVVCAECGEGAMEPRIRMRNGKPVCLSCTGDEYSRGW